MEKVTKVHSNKGTKVSFKRLRGTEVHRNKGLNLIISYENECLALMGGKILLCRGSAQKIWKDSRNSFK